MRTIQIKILSVFMFFTFLLPGSSYGFFGKVKEAADSITKGVFRVVNDWAETGRCVIGFAGACFDEKRGNESFRGSGFKGVVAFEQDPSITLEVRCNVRFKAFWKRDRSTFFIRRWEDRDVEPFPVSCATYAREGFTYIKVADVSIGENYFKFNLGPTYTRSGGISAYVTALELIGLGKQTEDLDNFFAGCVEDDICNPVVSAADLFVKYASIPKVAAAAISYENGKEKYRQAVRDWANKVQPLIDFQAYQLKINVDSRVRSKAKFSNSSSAAIENEYLGTTEFTELRLFDSDGNLISSTQVDERGDFVFPDSAPPGEYRVLAKIGNLEEEQTVTVTLSDLLYKDVVPHTIFNFSPPIIDALNITDQQVYEGGDTLNVQTQAAGTLTYNFYERCDSDCDPGKFNSTVSESEKNWELPFFLNDAGGIVTLYAQITDENQLSTWRTYRLLIEKGDRVKVVFNGQPDGSLVQVVSSECEVLGGECVIFLPQLSFTEEDVLITKKGHQSKSIPFTVSASGPITVGFDNLIRTENFAFDPRISNLTFSVADNPVTDPKIRTINVNSEVESFDDRALSYRWVTKCRSLDCEVSLFSEDSIEQRQGSLSLPTLVSDGAKTTELYLIAEDSEGYNKAAQVQIYNFGLSSNSLIQNYGALYSGCEEPMFAEYNGQFINLKNPNSVCSGIMNWNVDNWGTGYWTEN